MASILFYAMHSCLASLCLAPLDFFSLDSLIICLTKVTISLVMSSFNSPTPVLKCFTCYPPDISAGWAMISSPVMPTEPVLWQLGFWEHFVNFDFCVSNFAIVVLFSFWLL